MSWALLMTEAYEKGLTDKRQGSCYNDAWTDFKAAYKQGYDQGKKEVSDDCQCAE